MGLWRRVLACLICGAPVTAGAVPTLSLYAIDTTWTNYRALLVVDHLAAGETVTPLVAASGAADVRVTRGQVAADGSNLYYIECAQSPGQARVELDVRLKEIQEAQATLVLTPGLNLTKAMWTRFYVGGEKHASETAEVPPADASWTTVGIPSIWEDKGITWVRTSFVVPAELRGSPLWLHIGAIDDADATFLNGTRIGVTDGWDKPRDYAIASELVRWGEQNDLCIAVENTNWGGGVYKAPILISTQKEAKESVVFPEPALMPEKDRVPQGAVGARLPLRPVVVRNGVLRYEDGGEPALWGVNYYPQSYTQFDTLKKHGVDLKRAIDEDFEDFGLMGVDLIRIHVFDQEISDAQGGLVVNEHLDALDYLVSRCNERGIYLMLTPLAWWGSPNSRLDSFSHRIPKPAMTLWPEAWPIEIRYVREFLTHVNPYTQRRLADEPCLALLEIINEPDYLTFEQVRDRAFPSTTPRNADTKAAMDGICDAWSRFVPAPEWQTPEMFFYFRYDTLRRYIDTMVDAIRGTGARQPVAYFRTWWGAQPGTREAIGASRCDAVTSGAYPGDLPIEPANDGKNLLARLENTDMEACLAGKARLVYEFDAAGTRRAVHMYPAIARMFRHAGVQTACQFQYDSRAVAHLNLDWPQHYLNLRHTPEKAVSFMIAGEVFRRFSRGATFDTPEDDQVFGAGAVSFRYNTALLCAPDCYMQARGTDWRPLELPRQPKRIVSVGSCPYFDYDGTGVAILEVQGDTATLSLLPDVDQGREGLTGTDDEPLTRLVERSHSFAIKLDGWQHARFERQETDGSVPADCAALTPGTYRVSRQ